MQDLAGEVLQQMEASKAALVFSAGADRGVGVRVDKGTFHVRTYDPEHPLDRGQTLGGRVEIVCCGAAHTAEVVHALACVHTPTTVYLHYVPTPYAAGTLAHVPRRAPLARVAVDASFVRRVTALVATLDHVSVPL